MYLSLCTVGVGLPIHRNRRENGQFSFYCFRTSCTYTLCLKNGGPLHECNEQYTFRSKDLFHSYCLWKKIAHPIRWCQKSNVFYHSFPIQIFTGLHYCCCEDIHNKHPKNKKFKFEISIVENNAGNCEPLTG